MDQGIIASFKLQYRRQWLNFMLQQYEKAKDPLKTVTLLNVIQWTTFAWNQKVDSTVVEKCFWKSTCVIPPKAQDINSIDIIEQRDKELLRAQVMSLPNVSNPLTIDEFIQPQDEQIDDDLEDIMESLIDTYSQVEDYEESQPREEEEVECVSHADAIRALKSLKLYELQQDQGDRSNILALERFERLVIQRKDATKKQVVIDGYFNKE
jgi:DDE superfamily endonuclease